MPAHSVSKHNRARGVGRGMYLWSVRELQGKGGCPLPPIQTGAQSTHPSLGSLFCRSLSLLMGGGLVGFGVPRGPRDLKRQACVITPAPYPSPSPITHTYPHPGREPRSITPTLGSSILLKQENAAT